MNQGDSFLERPALELGQRRGTCSSPEKEGTAVSVGSLNVWLHTSVGEC